MRFLIWKERSNCQNTVHSPNEIWFIFLRNKSINDTMAKGWIGNKYTINLELYYSWIVTGYCKRSTTAELPDLDPKCQPGLRWHQGSQQDQLCFQKHRKLRFWSKQSDSVGPSMRLMNDDNKHQWDIIKSKSCTPALSYIVVSHITKISASLTYKNEKP